MNAEAAPLRLLLIEDDRAFGAALADGLTLGGHQVQWLTEGHRAEATLLAHRYDAVLLDLGLPDVDGERLLRDLRQRQDPTPVLVLSARAQRDDRIGLLDLGADDYLVKPVDLGELEARLRAVIRRSRQAGAGARWLQHGALRVDPAGGPVLLRGQRVLLREREHTLLTLFMRHPRRVFTRPQLESELFGATPDTPPGSNVIEVYVHQLRRRLVSDLIVTVRGQGYRLGPAPRES